MSRTSPLIGIAVLVLSMAAPLGAGAQVTPPATPDAAPQATPEAEANAAPEVAPETALRVIGAFRSNDCMLNADQEELFAADMDVTPEDYTVILADLIDRGFATGDAALPGAVALTPEFCGPQHADPAEVMVTVMRWNGCSMTGQEAPQLLLPMGFFPPDVANLVAQLRDEDRLIIEPTLLTLTDEACAAPAQ